MVTVFRDHLLLSRPAIPRKASVATYIAFFFPSPFPARHVCTLPPFALHGLLQGPFRWFRGPRNLELSPEDTRVCASRMSIYIATRARQHENKRRKCRGNEKESETLLACKQVASDSLIVAGSLGMIRSHATIFRLPSFPKQKLGRFEPAHCLESR